MTADEKARAMMAGEILVGKDDPEGEEWRMFYDPNDGNGPWIFYDNRSKEIYSMDAESWFDMEAQVMKPLTKRYMTRNEVIIFCYRELSERRLVIVKNTAGMFVQFSCLMFTYDIEKYEYYTLNLDTGEKSEVKEFEVVEE